MRMAVEGNPRTSAFSLMTGMTALIIDVLPRTGVASLTMSTIETFRLAEQRSATAELAHFATACRHDGVPTEVQERIGVMLVDLLGVTLVGSRTPELRALTSVWRADDGAHATVGSVLTGSAETVAHLDAIAACCLELDEGNKHAAGHPAAHVVFAAESCWTRSRSATRSPRASAGPWSVTRDGTPTATGARRVPRAPLRWCSTRRPTRSLQRSTPPRRWCR
jgi:hypothetical protein